jgi:uncharacterized protein (DUF362 family)/Pyruvate/2-oxoacid:ferredoxin oxidoreductase delta subunit
MRVVLKPNLLNAKKPADAATTHPAFVEAVAAAVMDAGGIVTIIDSPGGPYTAIWLKRVYAVTGMEAVADATGAVLNADLRVETVALEDGALLKSVQILKPLIDADVVINLAKLKSHMMMVYSGAVKNMFGAVAGTEKADYHARMNDYDRFAHALVDICRAAAPTLSLIDGITAMEGEGPGSGTPRHLGVIIAAENPFDADAVALDIIGVPFARVPVMRAGIAQGRFDPETLRVVGIPAASVRCVDFDVPTLLLRENGARPEKTLFHQFGSLVRPRLSIRTKDCIRCRKCLESCPVKVIRAMPDKTLVIDSSGCIRCFCCHELCPEKAIDIRRGWVSRLLVGNRLAGRKRT